jgi:ribosome-binding protein aMBF1 (putative translation factor)
VLTFSTRRCTLVHVRTYDIPACKRAMYERGLEQKDIAEKIGWSESVVSKFFRGLNVRQKVAAAIIHALGLKVRDVMTVDDEEEELVGSRR